MSSLGLVDNQNIFNYLLINSNKNKKL